MKLWGGRFGEENDARVADLGLSLISPGRVGRRGSGLALLGAAAEQAAEQSASARRGTAAKLLLKFLNAGLGLRQSLLLNDDSLCHQVRCRRLTGHLFADETFGLRVAGTGLGLRLTELAEKLFDDLALVLVHYRLSGQVMLKGRQCCPRRYSSRCPVSWSSIWKRLMKLR